MKTLKDIAGIYKSETIKAIRQGPTKAFKTGNLYRNVDQSNKASSMVIKQKGPRKGEQKYSFKINVSPQGAPYGKFVHGGTSKMRARPYAKVGASSPLFKKAMDEFMNGQSEITLDGIFAEIDKKWTSVDGLSVS
mgnify:FL=1